jgi:hypothetical protein
MWARVLVCLAFSVFIGGDQPNARQARDTPTVHALLIGVTRYPNLKERFQLQGPINDVALMRSTLQSRLPFKTGSIVELSSAPTAKAAPTRANIEREFTRLAASVNRGDRVVIFYAGHGSQEPDRDPRGTDEDDGLDEIILPSDVGAWDGAVGHVRNAISDDEIRRWLTAIRNRGAFVVALFDACQSSTLTRGELETARQVPMTELVPADALASVASGTRGGDASESNFIGLDEHAGGIAALYAAQTTEPTPEKRLPNENAPVHGLFTYTLVEALEQSSSPISYRGLVEQVIERYRSQGRLGPTPGFEGGGLDEPFLYSGNWPGRAQLRLGDTRAGRPTVRAGAIHGLTAGTILKVFPPAGGSNPNQLVGHARITDLSPTDALLEPVAFGNVPAPSVNRLVRNSRAEVAMFNYGNQVLKIALHPDPTLQGSAARAITDALARLGTVTKGLAERARSIESADWTVIATGDAVSLAPASGWRIDARRPAEADNTSSPFFVGRATPTLVDRLAETAGRIARARALMNVATAPASPDTDVNLAVTLLRYHDEKDRAGTAVPLASGGRVLYRGDRVAFRARNMGKSAIDLTLLFLDSQYGIQAMFPRRDAESDGRISPGREIVSDAFTVDDTTVGWEQMIAIAVAAGPVRTDFRYLEQPSLELTAARNTAGVRGTTLTRSPLQELFDSAVFGQGTTRGLEPAELRKYAIKMLAWRTERR